MAVATPEHVPAWKRLGLKLKNGTQAANEVSASPAAEQPSSSTKTKKRKATEISGTPVASHDKAVDSAARSESTPTKAKATDRPLKRKKSVAFADGTKNDDGDANEKLLEYYVAQQAGGEDQFSKAEVAQFTAPSKAHSANEPSTKLNGAPKEAKKEKKKKERTRSTDTKTQLQQDPSYVTYLKEYRSSPATWKFNKTQQIKLLNNIYNTYWLPCELDDALASYLAGLQGASYWLQSCLYHSSDPPSQSPLQS